MWNEKEVNDLDTGLTIWPSFDYNHDLDLEVSMSKFEIGPHEMGWADVPDGDRGYFRCRRAVDISNLTLPLIPAPGTHIVIYPWHTGDTREI